MQVHKALRRRSHLLAGTSTRACSTAMRCPTAARYRDRLGPTTLHSSLGVVQPTPAPMRVACSELGRVGVGWGGGGEEGLEWWMRCQPGGRDRSAA
jgi:hypothetical protein